MATTTNEYDSIKAGVNGMVDDAPAPDAEAPEAAPAAEMETGTTETIEPQSYENNAEQGQAYSSQDNDKLHEIAEAIINEKWQELLSSVGNIAVWKEKVDTNILSMKQEIIRMNERTENLQNAVLGKVREYDNDMKNVHTEMKALEKVFEKIIEPLTSNVKELGRITKEMKER